MGARRGAFPPLRGGPRHWTGSRATDPQVGWGLARKPGGAFVGSGCCQHPLWPSCQAYPHGPPAGTQCLAAPRAQCPVVGCPQLIMVATHHSSCSRGGWQCQPQAASLEIHGGQRPLAVDSAAGAGHHLGCRLQDWPARASPHCSLGGLACPRAAAETENQEEPPHSGCGGRGLDPGNVGQDA